MGKTSKEVVSLEVNYVEIVDAVNEIENFWYMKKPQDLKLSNNIKAWLDRYDEKPEPIKLSDVSLKHFIRSYRKAYEDIFNENLEVLSEIAQLKKGEILSCENVGLQILEDFHDKKIVLKIGKSEFTISTMKKTLLHLGNGKLKDVGNYQEIWSFLALITDCKTENNKALARLFLAFSKGAFEFKRKHLIEINDKFKEDEFSALIDNYCDEITHIALLYVFFEPARRIEVVAADEGKKIKVRKNQESIHAISTIVALKLLRDGEVELKEVFSPHSHIVFFTRKGVNKYLNKSVSKKEKAETFNALEMQKDALAANAVTSSAERKGGFFSKLVQKEKILTANALKKYILDPDENEASESDNDQSYDSIKTEDISEDCTIL